MKKLLLLLFLLPPLIITGCAYSPEMMKMDAKNDIQTLSPSEIPLSKFTSATLKPIDVHEDIKNDPDKMAKANAFDTALQNKLKGLLNQWPAKNPDHGELIIQPELNHLRIINPGTRFWAGMMAGQSSVSLQLTLIDAKTGKQVATPELTKWTVKTGGRGVRDDNMLQYLSTMAEQYLLQNM